MQKKNTCTENFRKFFCSKWSPAVILLVCYLQILVRLFKMRFHAGAWLQLLSEEQAF